VGTECADDGGSAVYEVVVPGQRPAHVLMASSPSRTGLDTNMDIAARFIEAWKCPP
jgi:hypothetical protein